MLMLGVNNHSFR